MTVSATLYSSATGEWATPQEFFDALDDEFHFDFDAAASVTNHKCSVYYTQHDSPNGLSSRWALRGKVIWCNPPYGRNIGAWFVKAREAQREGATVVMLVPARTDTRWFHEHVWRVASEIRFVKGRLKFGDGRNSAPFPSMVVVYRAGE